MCEAVWKFLDTLTYFHIFKVAQGPVKILRLFLRSLHQLLDLLWGKTDSPESSIVSFSLERLVECLQTLRVFEDTQILFCAGFDERHCLSKYLNEGASPTPLFRERG